MHLLQGKEVRSVYFVFVDTISLLKDGHSEALLNLNPLSIERACALFIHINLVPRVRVALSRATGNGVGTLSRVIKVYQECI